MASGSNSRGLVLLLITSCFFITGILFDYMPMIIDDHIKRTIELATNDEIKDYWSRPPVDVNSYYWLYEVANPDEFQNKGDKARVRQLGPFHFVSRLERRIVSLSANKFRLAYNATRFMRLNESYSRDLLDKPVTLANPFYSAILEGVRINANQLDSQARAVAYGTINRLTEKYNESILARNTTARLALLGRPMPILTKLAKLARAMGMDSKMPEMSPTGQYGYAALTNATLQGPFEIYTGYQETARSLGDLISYEGKRRLNYYDGKCNRMQASAGELRPMPIDPDKRLEMFQPAFCRIIHLEPTGQLKLREGMAVSYTLAAQDFASATNNPDNRCFCMNSSGPASPSDSNPLDDNHCSLDGVIDLGPCQFGAPLLLAPSSMQLDSRIINSLAPDFDPELLHGEVNEIDLADDKLQIVILKRVGVPIRADITATIFLRLVRDPSFKETANTPEVSYLPLVTVRETVTIPPKLAQIIINLESFISLTYHIKVVMYLSAVVLLFWLSGHYYCLTSGDGGAGGSRQPRPPSHEHEPGGGGAGGQPVQLDATQLRRPSLAGSANGGAPPGTGNGSSGTSANGLRRTTDEALVLAVNAGGKRAAGSGQLKSSLVTAAATTATTTTREEPPQRQRQARSSSLLSGPRALGTVEEAAGGGGQPPASAGGDTTSSERANSADSSRSLPPSRHTSRLGSLSQTSIDLREQDEPAGARTNETSGGDGKAGAAAPALELGAAGGVGGGGGGGGGGNKRALGREPTLARRNLSEVSGGNEGGRRARQTTLASSRDTSPADISATRAEASGQPSASGSGDDSGNNKNNDDSDMNVNGEHHGNGNTNDDDDGGGDVNGGQKRAPPAGRRRKRKNWFMNVYSNLVQLLNGLRNTINDASQLEMNDNDYRDKQLEMLAGKIDNWYNGHGEAGPGGVIIGTGDEGMAAAAEVAASSDGAADARLMVSPATVAPETGSRPAAATTTAQMQTGGPGADRHHSAGAAPSDESPPPPPTTTTSVRAIANEAPVAPAGEPPPPTTTPAAAQVAAPGEEDGDGDGELKAEPAADALKREPLPAANDERRPLAEAGAGLESAPAEAKADPSIEPGGGPSEANSTERNGLNSRSMRVESSRGAIDEAGGSSAAGAQPDPADSEKASAEAARPSSPPAPPPLLQPTTELSDEQRPGEGRLALAALSGGRQSSELADEGPGSGRTSALASGGAGAGAGAGGGGRNSGETTEAAAAAAAAVAASADVERLEMEPETELAEKWAEELDKATTLDKIEAALNSSDDELPLAARACGSGGPIDNGRMAAAAGPPDGPPASCSEAGSMINSSTSLDSVIDLEASRAGATPTTANRQAANQSTTATARQVAVATTDDDDDDDYGGDDDDYATIDGGAHLPNKLSGLNGLRRPGPTANDATATTKTATATSTTATAAAALITTNNAPDYGHMNGHRPHQPIRSKGAPPAPAATTNYFTTKIARPAENGGYREKLVDDDDADDDRDDGGQLRRGGPVEMRPEHSSKSLVSNHYSLLQQQPPPPSGREPRPKLRALEGEAARSSCGDIGRDLELDSSRVGVENARAVGGCRLVAHGRSNAAAAAPANPVSADEICRGPLGNRRDAPPAMSPSTATTTATAAATNESCSSSSSSSSHDNHYDDNDLSLLINEIQSANEATASAATGAGKTSGGGQVVGGDRKRAPGEDGAPIDRAGNSLVASNKGKQRKQQHQAAARDDSHANDGSITLQAQSAGQEQERQHYSGAVSGGYQQAAGRAASSSATAAATTAAKSASKLIRDNNLRPSADELHGSDILNGKIISHYQNQLATTDGARFNAGGLGDCRYQAAISLVQVANHGQAATAGNHHNHHHHHQKLVHDRPVQPAGA